MAYLLAAALGGLISAESGELRDGDDVEIGLLFGPIHVDFVLPASEITRRHLAFFERANVPVRDPGVGYFVVGWGAQEFYTQTPNWSDLRLQPTLRAAFGDASVLRADVTSPFIAFSELPRLRLSTEQYEALLEAIASSDAGGAAIVPTVAGHSMTSGFLPSRGRFHLFRTCNTWINRILIEAGIGGGVWTPTPFSLRIAVARLVD